MAPMTLKSGIHKRSIVIRGFSTLKLSDVPFSFLSLKYAATVHIMMKPLMVGNKNANESGF